VEVLEQDVVAKVRVILEFLRAPVNGAPALGIPREGADEPLGNFSTHLEQIHQLARASGTFDIEVVAIVEIEIQERAEDQHVHGQPNLATPVRVAPEHPAIGLARQIVDAVLLPFDVEDVRIVFVKFGDGANAMRSQKLVLVQHSTQDSPQSLWLDQSQYAALVHSIMAGPGRVKHGD